MANETATERLDYLLKKSGWLAEKASENAAQFAIPDTDMAYLIRWKAESLVEHTVFRGIAIRIEASRLAEKASDELIAEYLVTEGIRELFNTSGQSTCPWSNAVTTVTRQTWIKVLELLGVDQFSINTRFKTA